MTHAHTRSNIVLVDFLNVCQFCLNIGLSDQYSDGKAARVWQLYIGESSERTEKYKNFLVKLLLDRGCNTVLDVACGTG